MYLIQHRVTAHHVPPHQNTAKVEEWSIKLSDIVKKSELGKGRSGITWLAIWRGEKVAAKMMDLKSSSSDKVQLMTLLSI